MTNDDPDELTPAEEEFARYCADVRLTLLTTLIAARPEQQPMDLIGKVERLFEYVLSGNPPSCDHH